MNTIKEDINAAATNKYIIEEVVCPTTIGVVTV
jgi:hypothetical protein